VQPAITPPAGSSMPSAPAAEPTVSAPRADWPAEQERRIVGLRIVARNGERFTGSSVRQALQGEGFMHGDMQIFHRSTGDGRVLLSAASLTRPGSFDLATMDSLLYRGLNLFAVLPGPLTGRETVDKLLLTGHTIAQRLRGELQDSRGELLNEARLAEMRREAAASDG
jgi:cell division protein ZipA